MSKGAANSLTPTDLAALFDDEITQRAVLAWAKRNPKKLNLNPQRIKAFALSQWFTDDATASALVDWAGVPEGSNVLEPSAGDGAIVRALTENNCFVTAIEPDEVVAARIEDAPNVDVWYEDFLTSQHVENVPFDWIVMNPPYDLGQDRHHLVRALQLADQRAANVAALILLPALAGLRRYKEIWIQYVPFKVQIQTARPKLLLASEEADFGPSKEYCFVLWDNATRFPMGKPPPTIEWSGP